MKRCRGAEGGEVQSRCRGADMEVLKRCGRGAEEVLSGGREVVQRCIGAEVHRCRGAGM